LLDDGEAALIDEVSDMREPLRRTFDSAANLYDVARPSYPEELISDLETRDVDVNLHFTREGKEMDLRDRLGAIRCPTVVLIGEADLTIPTHLGREIVEAIPDGLARLELGPDAAQRDTRRQPGGELPRYPRVPGRSGVSGQPRVYRTHFR
jgi:pimeloyl-ACP methyl ester carboxylesterase